MSSNISVIMKATMDKIIVAFLIVLAILIVYKIMLEEKFETVASLINEFVPVETEKIKPYIENGEIKNKPVFGSKYGTIKIPSIDLELPIYYGESLSVLKSGIGHDRRSFFPGEGGTVLYMGHNYKTFLARLPEVKNGDSIEVQTDYGYYTYKVFNSKVVGENDTKEAPIKNDEEMLIIYTCWPINNIGHADERYLVYAK